MVRWCEAKSLVDQTAQRHREMADSCLDKLAQRRRQSSQSVDDCAGPNKGKRWASWLLMVSGSMTESARFATTVKSDIDQSEPRIEQLLAVKMAASREDYNVQDSGNSSLALALKRAAAVSGIIGLIMQSELHSNPAILVIRGKSSKDQWKGVSSPTAGGRV